MRREPRNIERSSRTTFENELCRAVEIHLAPGEGEPEQHHQHLLDYALVWNLLNAEGKFSFWTPGPAGEKAVLVNGEVVCPAPQFKPVEAGDLTPGWAVHSVVNRVVNSSASPQSEARWLLCYQVELK